MSFFVSESLKGLLTEEELIEDKDNKNVFDNFSVVIGDENEEYFFEIKNYLVEDGIIIFNLSEHYLEKLFFNDALMIKKIVLGISAKEINYKFKIKNIQKRKNDVDYEIEIMF